MEKTSDPAGHNPAAPDPAVPDLVGPDPGSPDKTPIAAPRKRMSGKPNAIVTAGVVAALLITYVGAAWLLSDRVPRGTTVAGVAVGGMSSVAAEETLESSLADLTSKPMTVVAEGVEGELDPARAGLIFDADATVAHLTGFTLSPARMWSHVVGGHDAAPVSQVDRELLTTTLEGMAESFAVAPVDGGISFVDALPHPTPAEPGLEVDVDGAVTKIGEQWLTEPRPLALPVVSVEPAIDDAEVERALTEDATPLVEAPITAVVGETSAQLAPPSLAAAASFVAQGSTLELILDGKMLSEDLRAQIPELEQAPVNATVQISEGAPQITPDALGTEINAETLESGVLAASKSETRTVEVELAQVEADMTVADVEALGIVERISDFSTNLTNDEVRTNNLRTGAAAISGVIVMPGETFSLLDTLGPITPENGYGNAGVIIDGVVVDGMGGGLSQLATTVYNASFFAGLEDVEHQPHSQYINRYPEGREATIYVPSIDLKFKNDSDYGVLIESWVADGQLHVAFWSTKVWEIRTETGPRQDIVQPTTIISTRPGCVPSGAGNPGFFVNVDRHFYRDGVFVKTDSRGWRYQPVNAVQCG